jgi:ubiquinone/menaquinone biosynthesis C-methylase UbiE
VTDLVERMRDAYDRIAPEFALRNAAIPAEYRDVTGPRLLALARAAAGRDRVRVLDAGCGTGRDMAWLEDKGAAVVGADLSTGMLRQARRLTRGPLLQVDLRRLAFRPAAFHAVWCSASLLHLPKADAPAAVAELRRVLCPQGAAMVSLQEGAMEGWEPSPYDTTVERFFARYGADEAEALLTNAGFAIVHRSTGEAGTRRWLQFLAVAA